MRNHKARVRRDSWVELKRSEFPFVRQCYKLAMQSLSPRTRESYRKTAIQYRNKVLLARSIDRWMEARNLKAQALKLASVSLKDWKKATQRRRATPRNVTPSLVSRFLSTIRAVWRRITFRKES